MMQRDVDIRPQPQQHLHETVGREFLDMARHETRHLGRGVVHELRGGVTRQPEGVDTTLELAAEDRPRDAVLRQGIP